jgi:transcriptional regulator with XRE-family HTH domain
MDENPRRALRLKANLTLEQLARIVGASSSSVAKWEAGRVPHWNPGRMEAISQALGCTYEELISAYEGPKQQQESLKTAHQQLPLLPL